MESSSHIIPTLVTVASEKIYAQIFKPELTARFTNMNVTARDSLFFLIPYFFCISHQDDLLIPALEISCFVKDNMGTLILGLHKVGSFGREA